MHGFSTSLDSPFDSAVERVAEADPDIGLPMPCNVVARESSGRIKRMLICAPFSIAAKRNST